MTTSPIALGLIALLLPAASFLVIGLLPPLRRWGRAAAAFSIFCALGAFAAALLAYMAVEDMSIARIPWLPGSREALATVGILVDPVSSLMLVLVTLVSLLVQVY